MTDEIVPQVQENKQEETLKYDMGNEICSLWYELNYLRFLLSKIIEHAKPKENLTLIDLFNEQLMNEARKFSMDSLRLRFPGVNFNERNKIGEKKEEEVSQK